MTNEIKRAKKLREQVRMWLKRNESTHINFVFFAEQLDNLNDIIYGGEVELIGCEVNRKTEI